MPAAPERRRRVDLVAAAVLGAVAVIGSLLVVTAGDGGSTTLRTAERPLAAPPPGPVPTVLVEAWRAPSPATPAPLVVGPAVATVGPTPDGGGRVAGHDARTGEVAWEYRRPQPPCTAAAGFGDVLSVFRSEGPAGVWCSDVVALEPETGARGPMRHADLREGTRLLADRRHVTGTGSDYFETWRDDLVLTTEVGAVPTPVQPPEQQPRAACRTSSTAVGGERIAVTQRCAGEDSDRLTVVTATPQSSEIPEERLSVPTGVDGARVVATTGERVAWVGPDGVLRVLDSAAANAEVAAVPLAPGAAGDPSRPPVPVRPAGPVLLWWTGTATVALDADDLVPVWTRPGTLGPGTALPGTEATPVVVVPTPAGLDVLDAATGEPRGPAVPVAREPAPGPVEVAAVGTVIAEQRGDDVVALVPPP